MAEKPTLVLKLKYISRSFLSKPTIIQIPTAETNGPKQ